MPELEYYLLQICAKMVRSQQELVSLLAKQLKVQKEEFFYIWKTKPRSLKQRGNIDNTKWYYYLHGFECDFVNIIDGKTLLFHFGPKGRIDTITNWGVLNFILTSKDFQFEIKKLKRFIFANGKSLEVNSGVQGKMQSLLNQLEELGWLEPADIELSKLKDIKDKSTMSICTALDISVSHRPVISKLGWEILEEYHS